MGKHEFTYMLEPNHNEGYIWLFEGYQDEHNDLLFCHNEKELMKGLKQYKKGSVFVGEKDPILLQEGERLAKKLNLPFQHP